MSSSGRGCSAGMVSADSATGAGVVPDQAITRFATKTGRALAGQMFDPKRITAQTRHVLGINELGENHRRFCCAEGVNESRKIGNDVARGSDFQRSAFVDKSVLHINDEQRGFERDKTMGVIDDLQFGFENGVVGTHGRTVKSQKEKVKGR